MGRLDEHTKERVVELRKAGLSFRKIKKVLEQDNIHVTAQTIYLFLKRKNVEPPPAAVAQRVAGDSPAAWQALQLCPGLEGSEAGQEASAAVGSEQPCPHEDRASDEGIRIVSVTSFCKDGGLFRQPGPTGAPSSDQVAARNSDKGAVSGPSALGSCAALLPPTTAPQTLSSRGRLRRPPARTPALIVKKKIVDRAVLLQKKAKDASTQTVLNIMGAGSQNVTWRDPVLPSIPSSHTVAKKLDALHSEMQKLSRTVHAVLERQGRLEQQQQRLQQEVLMTLQQLSGTASPVAVPGEQPCVPFSGVAEPVPVVPNFSQFKMELI